MSKRILVVDDSTSNILLVQNFLEEEGYDVISATDGNIAVKMITDLLPDLVILDLMMPELSGIEVLELIKTNKSTQNIPVIFLSANKDINVAKQIISRGAKAFITKPLDFDVILDELNKNL